MKWNNINILFGNELRKIRETRGLSQEEFAQLCDISRAYYGRIERGEHSATLDIYKKIADALGFSLAELFVNLP